MRQTDPTRRGERGTALLELAVMLRLVLLVSLIIIEGANAVRVHQVLNNAAREGVRMSILPENRGHTAAVVQTVVDYAGRNKVTISSANITVDQARHMTLASGLSVGTSQVVVSYQYPFNYLPRLPWFTEPGNAQLRGAAEFRNFY